MAFEHYIRSGGKDLRLGYTTGTCAALAAAGAAEGLLTGRIPQTLCLMTPKGIQVSVKLTECSISYPDGTSDHGPCMEEAPDRTHVPCMAQCGVVKDAGDDRDATDGLLIMARAQYREWDPDKARCRDVSENIQCRDTAAQKDEKGPEAGTEKDAQWLDVGAERDAEAGKQEKGSNDSRIEILGGTGIGRVTKPGLEQKVGESAINQVPRDMIRREVLRVCDAQGYEGGITITIFAPDGEAAAEKTLNAQMGIIGGISIIGTSGIVEPMSMKAYADSVRLMIRQAAHTSIGSGVQTDAGNRGIILTPGNYGRAFLHQQGYDRLDIPIVACSNFIGDALDEAAADGFDRILLAGHAGKLVKLAAGIMNTHSSMADARAEIFTAHAAMAGASPKTCRRLMEAVTSDACISILKEMGIAQIVLHSIMEKAQGYLDRRCEGAMCGMIMFSNVYGELGSSGKVNPILDEWRKHRS